MKHLWLVTTAVMAFGLQAHAASEQKEEMDIEAEEMSADAAGSEYNAAYLNQKAEQQKLDTTLDVTHAEKVIHDSKTQQVYAEALIGKAEVEIKTLKQLQDQALARRKKAQEDRKMAVAKLNQTIKELKYYRARTKRAQALASADERSLNAVKMRTARLQSMMPAPAPRRPVAPVAMKKPRVSQAAVAQAR